MCRTGTYCSAACLETHDNHNKYCAAICALEGIEWEKRKRTLVCGVDGEKLPLKLKRKLIKLVGERPTLKFMLNNTDAEGLLDTGAMVSLLNRTFVDEHFPGTKIETIADFLGQEDFKLTTANKDEMSVSGVVVLEFGVPGNPNMFDIPFLVTDDPLSQPILGYNTIEYLVSNFANVINMPASIKSLFGNQLTDRPEVLVSVIESGCKITDLTQEARVQNRQVLKPGDVCKVRCKFADLQFNNPIGKVIVFSPLEEVCVEHELSILETTEKLNKNRRFVDVVVHNPTRQDIVLPKGMILGTVSDVAAAFPMPLLSPVEKTEVEVGEVSTTESREKTPYKFDLEGLTDEQKSIATQMLEEESEAFAKDQYDIGHITDFQLKIKLTDEIPVVEPYRKIPPHFYQEVKDHIHNLLANGWVRRSFSEYSSPQEVWRPENVRRLSQVEPENNP